MPGPGQTLGGNANSFHSYGNGGFVGWKSFDLFFNGAYIGSSNLVSSISGGRLDYSNGAGLSHDIGGFKSTGPGFAYAGGGIAGGQNGHNANYWVF